MKPVDQEFFYETDDEPRNKIGDCVRASTASVLELELKDVPHFVKDQPGDDWYDTWERFMISHGIKPIMVDGPWENGPPKLLGYYLASGPVARGGRHMLVMYNGTVAHDPHPSRAGLLVIEAIWMLK